MNGYIISEDIYKDSLILSEDSYKISDEIFEESISLNMELLKRKSLTLIRYLVDIGFGG